VPPLVLVVEDEKILAESICIYLERNGYAVGVANSGEDGLRLAEQASPDVAIVDIRLPGIDGLEVLRRLRDISPGTEVVMATAHGSVTSAVEAMKRGAFDYLNKPVDLEELRVVVEKALGHLRLRRELSYLKSMRTSSDGASEILGESPAIRTLRADVDRIAALESVDGGAPSVLILGETGTGKGVVAHAIHERSPRASAPFVEINCAAIPSTLLEAELFGYERGAYTDARTAKPGLFEAAEGGTLFLDEIGHMDPLLQVKLLKVIEDRAVRRLGGLRTKSVNARIIAATNRDLDIAIADGSFRADLYFRIKVLTLFIPPLRARGDDVTLLAAHFLEKFARQYGRRPRTLAPAAEAAVLAYEWPGNVRELAHVMERAAILHDSSRVGLDDLGLSRQASTAAVAVKPDEVHVDFSAGSIVLDDVERQLIVKALEASGGNRSHAAQLLGISRDTLRYRLEKFKLT
jgi:two-component system, NtrC family, response regulator AtoC